MSKAQQLIEKSMTVAQTVTAPYSVALADDLYAASSMTGCQVQGPEAVYFWGPHPFDDVGRIWMVKLELPGEA